MTIHHKMYDEKNKRPDDEKLTVPTVMVSGGFDPVHAGHIRMIRDAANFGDVIVVANSDQWLYRKKGFVFMDFNQRAEILNAIKGVILVDSVDDTDGTVCEAIQRLKPDFFANGGDRGRTNTPEMAVCEKLGVKLLWGVGGDKKLASSSDLVKNARDFEQSLAPPIRATTKHSDR
jgi:D-beta-D-heptose 7-phosphate kinase/D-beta-D-heptose 1-phosphate adenosyltransferase|tara:strand:- start:1209 stop:1733 length:525 start_codon:yes stop_codon:yes gene_type:complete